jgi:DNA excision repair protein ERCC-4
MTTQPMIAPKRATQIVTPRTQAAVMPNVPELPEMPTLREPPGRLMPVVICDTREKLPLPVNRLRVIRDTLPTGDYSYGSAEESFCVERKSLDDLAQSLTRDRERFCRELQRLKAYEFRRVVVIGTRKDIVEHRYRSEASPKAMLNSIDAFELRYGVPVVYFATAEEAANQLERWVLWHAREAILRINGLIRGLGAEVSMAATVATE